MPPRSIAALAEIGVGRGRLQGKAWRKVAPGFYVPQGAGTVTETSSDGQVRRRISAQRILDAVPLLEGEAALGTWAAAYILGADWLDGRDPHTMAELPLDIMAPNLKRRSTEAVTYHCSSLRATDTWTRDGIRITSPLRATFDGARWAASLEEAVVFIDTMAAFALIRIPDLAAYATEHAGWSGVGQVVAAGQLARPGVKSGWETRLRLVWTRQVGLPTPMINVPIFNRAGDFLGEADLFDPDSGLVAEYDGGQHRAVSHHHNDNIREERFESANLVVVRADKVDLRDERELLFHRLLDGYHRGQARDRGRDDWTLTPPAWWAHRFTRPSQIPSQRRKIAAKT